ncbi:MAG: peroxiredoxin family protein, partial [Ktedonobacteraceae bacterium]
MTRGASGVTHSAGAAANAAASGGHASTTTPVAPDFTLTTLNGAAYHLVGQRGHVVVLYFMSTTCTECVRGTYFVATAMQEIASPKAEAIAIDMNPGDTAKDISSFEQSASIASNAPLTWVFDGNQRVASRYGVLALGTVFVVDPQGHIVYESDGSVVIGQLVQVV